MDYSIEGRHYKTLVPIRVGIKEGLISKIEKITTCDNQTIIAPGLVDLQVNGFQGIDFNETQTTKEAVKEVTQSLWDVGVTSYFPTVITNSDDSIMASLNTISAACSNDPLVDQTIKGIHLEGPFISKETGPLGAHPAAYVQEPNWELFCNWQKRAEGRIKLLTMSPEWPKSTEFIRKCVASGVKVAIGHTAATPLQIKESVEAGASLSTHLGNAAHLMLPRHTNYIWEQLANEQLWCSCIADGFHLPEAVLKIIFKVKLDKCILVSDSTKFAGLRAGSYQSPIGGAVELQSTGRLSLKESPELLAGSAKSLLDCIEYLVANKLLSLSDALDMASTKPFQYLEPSSIHGLTSGAGADLMVFDQKDGKIRVLKVIKSGHLVHSF